MHIFRSLSEAIEAGYQVYEQTPEGYLVRTKIDSRHWAMALVLVHRDEG